MNLLKVNWLENKIVIAERFENVDIPAVNFLTRQYVLRWIRQTSELIKFFWHFKCALIIFNQIKKYINLLKLNFFGK